MRQFIRRQIEQGTGWSAAASLCAQAGAALTAAWVSRSLGAHAFGQYSVVQGTAQVVGGLGAAGLGFTATKLVAAAQGDTGPLIARLTRSGVAAGLAFAVLLAATAELVATRVFSDPGLASPLRIGAAAVGFLTLAGIQQGALIGRRSFRALCGSSVLQLVAGLAALAVAVPLWGLNGAAIALAAAAAFQVAAQWWWLRPPRVRGFVTDLSRDEADTRDLSRDPGRALAMAGFLPMAAASIAGQAGVWASRAVLANTAQGMVEVALFSVAFTVRQAVAFAPAMMARTAGPVLYGSRASRPEFRGALHRAAVQSGLVALAVALPLALAARPVLSFFGPQYGSAATVLHILLASAVVESAAVTLYHQIVRDSRFTLQFVVVTVWSGCLLAGAPGGAAGLAWGYLAGWLMTAAAYAVSGCFEPQDSL